MFVKCYQKNLALFLNYKMPGDLRKKNHHPIVIALPKMKH